MREVNLQIGETLHLGDDIQIEITSFSKQQVKIGVAAPKDKRILREELWAEDQKWRSASPSWWQAVKRWVGTGSA